MKRRKTGDKDKTIVTSGNSRVNHLNQLKYPTDIFVDEDDSLYASDRLIM